MNLPANLLTNEQSHRVERVRAVNRTQNGARVVVETLSDSGAVRFELYEIVDGVEMFHDFAGAKDNVRICCQWLRGGTVSS